MTTNNQTQNARKTNARTGAVQYPNQARAVTLRIKQCKRGVTVKSLVEKMGVTQSVVTQVVNTLESVGMVEAVKIDRVGRGRPEYLYVPTEIFI